MRAGQKNFHKGFARVSPVFVAALLALACARTALSDSPSANNTTADATASVRKEAASAQFAKAEQLRSTLGDKPASARTLAEYKQVALAYRRVALITPRAPEVPESLVAMAEVYTEMGDRFGRTYYQSAADSYLFLVREYPGSRFCPDALLRAAKLERDELSESQEAQKTYSEFLKKYPRSTRKKEVQQALAELALLENDAPDGKPDSAKNGAAENSVSEPRREPAKNADAETRVAERETSGGEPSESGNVPRVRRIRAEATDESTRVTIDLEDNVQYTSARIAHPDRIFFDLHAARLTPELLRGTIHVEGSLLSAVRVAQNQVGVVRIVLDINSVKDYTASLMHNPTQLLIELYPNGPTTTARRRAGGEETAASKRDGGSMQPVAAKKPDDDSERTTSTIIASTGTNSGARRTGNDAARSGGHD